MPFFFSLLPFFLAASGLAMCTRESGEIAHDGQERGGWLCVVRALLLSHLRHNFVVSSVHRTCLPPSSVPNRSPNSRAFASIKEASEDSHRGRISGRLKIFGGFLTQDRFSPFSLAAFFSSLSVLLCFFLFRSFRFQGATFRVHCDSIEFSDTVSTLWRQILAILR